MRDMAGEIGPFERETKVRTKVLWSVAAVLVAAGTVRAAEVDNAKAGLAKRIEQLKNVVVAYDLSTTPSQRVIEEVNTPNGGRNVSVMAGAQRQQKFSYLDGKARYESKEKNLPKVPPTDSTTTMVIMHDIAGSAIQIVADGSRELLCGYRDDSYFKGFIMAGAKLEGDDTIDVPLGMRIDGKWLDANAIAACKAVDTVKGGVLLEFVQAGGPVNKWRLSAVHGYAPIVQEVVGPDLNLQSRTDMSDWKKVGDVWVAHKAVRTEFNKGEDGKPIEGFKYVFTIKSCEVGSKENVPALYKMNWPDGTIVKGKDGKQYEAKGGKLQPLKAPSSSDNFRNPQPLPEGTIITNENGQKYRLINGQFQPVDANQ